MTPMHGFASTRSGLRTRSFGNGGSLGAGAVVAARLSAAVFLPTTISDQQV